jgi:hypothetical protein
MSDRVRVWLSGACAGAGLMALNVYPERMLSWLTLLFLSVGLSAGRLMRERPAMSDPE